jgi:hypothetical protein
MYRAMRQADGSIFFMINFSDLNRTSQCLSGEATFPNPKIMLTKAGVSWQKMP